jgi:hypothetical protein
MSSFAVVYQAMHTIWTRVDFHFSPGWLTRSDSDCIVGAVRTPITDVPSIVTRVTLVKPFRDLNGRFNYTSDKERVVRASWP